MATANTPATKTAPHVIFGVHVSDRTHHAGGVQAVLTEFGDAIKTRIGLHDVHDGYCSPNGLLLIEFVGDAARCDALVKRLSTVQGVEMKQMVFDHP
jgi:hypothetical protein